MIEKEVLNDVMETIKNPDKISELVTGFYDLDETLRGIKKSSIVVIGARPAMGKTAFAENIMLNLLQNKKKCLFFSLEMSQQMTITRLLVQLTEINAIFHHSESLTLKNLEKVSEVIKKLSEYDLTIDDTSVMTIEKIREKINAENPEYVFIDYLQLICLPENKSKTDGIAEIMADLKQIAKDNNCMIFINSQLTRAPESRSEHRPLLSDLKGCGAIVESADVVMFLYRDAYYNMIFDDEDEVKSVNSAKDIAEIIVAKNKTGPVASCRLIFNGEILKFFNPIKIF